MQTHFPDVWRVPMANLSPFCSCTNLKCPIHPTKHDKGCAPCIAKNLKLKEIPNCLFNLVEGSQKRTADYFEDFAECVLKAVEAKKEQ